MFSSVRIFAAALLVPAVLAFSQSAGAVAMPMQHSQEVEAEPAQASGIVTPGLATGFVQINQFKHFEDGSLAIGWCAKTDWAGDCSDMQWLPPAQAVKKLRGEKARYVGFQLFVLKETTRLFLYLK
jgi:hypothetical protein